MTTDNLPPLPQPEFDNLLDHIYEYGTLAEGTIPRARALCEAYARAAILAERTERRAYNAKLLDRAPWADDVEAWLEASTSVEIEDCIDKYALAVAERAVLAERERCAEVCEAEAEFSGSNGKKDASALNCAAAIREGGK